MKRITLINDSINTAINTVSARASGYKLQEPDYNATLSIEFPNEINKSGLFTSAKFGGCNIHQSPYAHFISYKGLPVKCELGDLLVLCRKKIDMVDRFNAALIQWKIMDKGEVQIIGKEQTQLEFYERWPEFTLSGDKSIHYRIKPHTVTPGAQYGLIHPTKPVSLFSTIPSTTMSITRSNSFARFIINLMNWQTGRPFELEPDTTDQWSLLICHLINASAKKMYTQRGIGDINKPRISNADFLSILISDSFEPIPTQAEDSTECPDAISILYINCSASDN